MSLEDPLAFVRLAELAPDAMVAHRAGSVLWANAAAASIFGFDEPADLVGVEILDHVAPEQRGQVTERVRRMRETGQAAPLVEEVFLGKDGARVDVEVRAAPIGGGIILVVARDIRPRKAAERAERLVESRVQAMFETTREALGVSQHGVHVVANAAYARLFGYDSPTELIGTPILDLIAVSEHARILDYIRKRSAREPLPDRYLTAGRRRDGAEFAMEARISDYEEHGQVFTVAVLRDVTEQHAWEQRLAESERRYRELVESVPVGIWEEDLSEVRRILGALGAADAHALRVHLETHPEVVAACAQAVRVIDVNTTACVLVGARSKAELRAHLDDIFVPESLGSFAEELVQLWSGQRPVVVDGWNGTLQGDRRRVAVSVALALGHEHDWERALVTCIDITELWRANEDRAALRERLLESAKHEAIGRLAGGVAHDFNNILAAVLGFAEVSLLQASPGTPLYDAQLQIVEAVRRARDVVRQILTVGRRARPELQPVEVAKVVSDALRLARAAIPATVIVDARIDPQAGVALVDPTQLHQIVLNLCSNARDAVAARGRIELELQAVDAGPGHRGVAEGKYVRLRVRDDGVGMDETTRGRIFEPYMTTKARSGGHGLGLAVVHGIVSQVGGAIVVESSPGRGSTFDIYLTRSDESVPAPPPIPAAGPSGGVRILLVDDDPAVRAVQRQLLESLDHVVVAACDGDEALHLSRTSGPFDLVVTDQTMPGMTGMELARTLLAERPDAAIVLCTGYADAIDEAQARAVGLRGLLAKPAQRTEIAAMVQRALGRG